MAEDETLRPSKPAITLEQLRPYYQGVYFATVSIKKMFADEGLEGGNLAKRLDGYQELVTEYNEAIKETVEASCSVTEILGAFPRISPTASIVQLLSYASDETRKGTSRNAVSDNILFRWSLG